MPKLVGFIFAAIAGLVAAAWLYGGSTWGPGFAAKEAAAPGLGTSQFKLSSVPPADKPTGDPAPAASASPTASAAPPRPASDQSPPPSTEATTGSAPPAFNTGGNPNVEIGAGPNWGLGYGVGRTGK